MSNYNWAVSIGGTIVAGAGTNAITVLWPYAGQRTVSVTYTTPTGCATVAPTIFNVLINPAAVPVIGGGNSPCINTSNQYITNSGMSNYQWNISPGGTITSGQFTNTINVSWTTVGAQWVNVSYTNTYGCVTVTPTVLNLFVSPLPNPAGPVTGVSTLCAGTDGVAYSCADILNATSYVWTLPAGATIASGSGTSSITVNFSLTATSGNISVAGSNDCGTGTPSPSYSVTVNPIPPAPVVTVNGSVLTSSAPAGNQWYYQGTLLAGATGKVYTATKSGYYWCEVTVNGCTSAISNKVYVVMLGTEEISAGNIRIYPVPNDGTFTVSFGTLNTENISVTVSNPLGARVFEAKQVKPDNSGEYHVRLENAVNGIYFVEVTGKDFSFGKKIVVNR